MSIWNIYPYKLNIVLDRYILINLSEVIVKKEIFFGDQYKECFNLDKSAVVFFL